MWSSNSFPSMNPGANIHSDEQFPALGGTPPRRANNSAPAPNSSWNRPSINKQQSNKLISYSFNTSSNNAKHAPERPYIAGPPMNCGTSKEITAGPPLTHSEWLESDGDYSSKTMSASQSSNSLYSTQGLGSKKPKKVPPELIEGFLNGAKNPVSALMEYSAMSRLSTTFQECPLNNAALGMRFACVCTVDEQEYPQGQGKTKKEAKTNAAKIAFTHILGMDVEEDSESARVVYDSMGRKIVIQSDYTAGTSQVVAVDREVAHQQVLSAAGALTRNPVSVLQEFCQKKRMPFTVSVEDVAGPDGFVASVTVNNETEPIAQGVGKTKKEAKRMAADNAVHILMHLDAPQQPEEEATHFDKIATFAHRKLYALMQGLPEYLAGRKVVAAFIVQIGDDEGEVVALGTGNTCIDGYALSLEGRVLNDSHAEVIARRAFLKYLYKEVKSYYETGSSLIFKPSTTSPGLLAVHDNVGIHLYISTAPCGDGALFSPSEIKEFEEDESILAFVNDRELRVLGDEIAEQIEMGEHKPTFSSDAHGNLRTKIETGEGTIPLDKKKDYIQTWDGILHGTRLRTMSCSDKILRWNILGVQGSLLSLFVEPIYITSISLGNLFDHGHLSRAVCCRISDEVNAFLPDGYMLNHPYLGRVTMYDVPRGCEKTNSLSVNWSHGDDKIEICDGRSGKSIDRSPYKTGASNASRLCKAGFLHRFREIAKLTKRNDLMAIENYRQAKDVNSSYERAKLVFKEKLQERGYGCWVKKPVEQDLFKK